ncbi:hypothetical protein BJX63DRAFT_437959 [Aspergillus granulosus]|uniref:Uncharacterized protein n=1 Tax=Aspergillus granulosus TaxID=176169 RepID=A0ABR4GTG2_9EURO
MPSSNPHTYGDATEPIAIIGMATRFSGEATNTSKFWDMMVQHRTGHSAVPENRFDAEAWYHPSHERRGTIQPRSGFFLREDPAVFDAPFFSMTAKEAAGMDPMQRKLLEISYEAFENAGIPMSKLPGSATGVYSGVMTNDYELMTAGDPMHLPQNAASGTSRAMLANRISWFYDLRGPSFALDTACSSSLYALHLACQSLQAGETQQALVTGVNLILAPNFISQLSSMHMLSPDGKSHSFDSRANGYARGEALAAVVVKPLHQALADGDTIRAVIRGSGANQDGKTVGITIPNPQAQADLIRKTYATAGLGLDQTGYFEAHGTGTPVGDPIELSAIGASFGEHRSQDCPLIVGSVKTNVGHTEGAAGLAGVVKTVLALETGIIPPLADFQELNEKLRLEDWKLALPLKATPWPMPGLRRASVNSFGFGGANAHVILDDAYHYLKSRGLDANHHTTPLESEDSSDSGLEIESASGDIGDGQPSKLLLFSTYDGAGIKRTEATWNSHLTGILADSKGVDETIVMNDLAYTLSERRTTFDFRSFAVASSVQDLKTKLDKDGLPRLNRVSRRPNPVFVFTGQGAQWPAMGRELLSNPVFRASIERSKAIIEREGCEWDVLQLLSDPKDQRIHVPAFSQPVCTIIQIAIVDLLQSWDIRPAATVGHSSGEVAAAYAAKLISQDEAVRVGYWRGFYSEQVKTRLGDVRGSMMAVGLSESQATSYLNRVPEGSVVIACINSPSSVTLSGEDHSIQTLEAILQADGHFARKLRVEVAYHSPHMKTVADEFLNAVGIIAPQPSEIPMFSSVTETRIEDPATLVASYWMQNLISPVRFSGALTNLLNDTPGVKANTRRRRTGVSVWSALIEIGPHEALKGPCRQIMSGLNTKLPDQIPYMSALSRGKNAVETSLTAAGLLWASGHPVNIHAVNQYRDGGERLIPDLPPYPWNHEKSFWHEPATSMSARLRKEPRDDLLGVPVAQQNPFERSWQNYLSVSECPWQKDHVITGTVLYPGAGHLIMALEAAIRLAAEHRPLKGVTFSDVHFDKGLVIPSDDHGVETRLCTRPHERLPDWYHYTLYSVDTNGDWTKHSWGAFSLHYDDVISLQQAKREKDEYNDICNRACRQIDVESLYDQLQSIGTEYGPAFRNLVDAAAVPGEHSGVGTITIPDTRSVMPHEFEYPHLIHPATLDAIFHLIFVAMGEGNALSESAIPTRVDRIFISTDLPRVVGAKYTGFGRAEPISGRDTLGTIVVSDETWSAGPMIIVEGMTITEVSAGASTSPNSLLTPGGQGRIATLEWKEDVDSLVGLVAEKWLIQRETSMVDQASGASEAVQHLDAWLELACFKSTDLRTLVICPSNWENGFDLVKKYGSKHGERYRFSQTTIIEFSEHAVEVTENSLALHGIECSYVALDPSVAADNSIDQLGVFDLIIAQQDVIAQLPHATKLLYKEGRVAVIGPHAVSEELQSATEGLLKEIFFASQDGSNLQIAGLGLEIEPVIRSLDEVALLQHADASPAAKGFEEQLTTQLTSLGARVRSITLADVRNLSGEIVISLLEIDRPFVISWTSEEFEQFRQLTNARYLLWITRGGLLEADRTSLDYAPSTGLLRTVRVEKPQIRLPHLDLSPSLDLSSEHAVEMVISAFHSSIKASVKDKNLEMEYAESNGLLYIPRAQGHAALDYELALRGEKVSSIPGPLFEPGVARRLETSTTRSSSQTRWVPEETFGAKLAEFEVEIQVSHVGLEHNKVEDFLTGKQLSPTPDLGRVAVGIVTTVGAKVSRFIPGDQVFALQTAAFHTHLRVSEAAVHAVPDVLSPVQAAYLPLAAARAWHSLIGVAGFRAKQTVFVNGASDTIGRLIIQLAQLLKGDVFASVYSEAEQRTLMESYNMPPDHIFSLEHPTAWASDLKAAIGRTQLDIVINNATTGPAIRSLSEAVASGGCFVDLTQRLNPSLLGSKMFQRNVTLSFVDWESLTEPQLGALMGKSLDLVRTGSLSPIEEVSVFSISDLSEALRAVGQPQQEQAATPVVVELSADATVPLPPSPPAPLHLRSDGTYILAGGLGALGLTIAENMCSHGAGHLVFLSRSGASSQRQKEALESFRARGCKVDVVKCDVTDQEQVQVLAARIQEHSWNVRGVIQLAMVLRDSIFENMTFDKWETAVNPKIKGTWNLHAQIPHEVDFFIILSSLSGIIGNTAQANYCAGNAYEDALAHYRRKLGLAATTLNVGLVTDASHFNENSTIEDYLRKYSHWIAAQVTDSELQYTITAVMRGTIGDKNEPVPDQLLVGLSDNVRRDGDSLNLWPQDRKFDHRISLDGGPGAVEKDTNRQKLQASTTVTQAHEIVEAALRLNVAAAMTASPDDIDVEKPLYAFGIDSLKAIEVRNWIFGELQADVSVFEVLSPMSLSRLALKIVSKSTLVSADLAAEAAAESVA